MERRIVLGSLVVLLTAVFGACNFSEYSQEAEVIENIDDYRTGCEIDADRLLAEYKQYEANRYFTDSSEFYFGFGPTPTPNPTPTPGPITGDDLATRELLETVWENGCATGRRDASDAEQATLMALQDQLDLLSERIAALEPIPTPTPTPSPTPAATATPEQGN